MKNQEGSSAVRKGGQEIKIKRAVKQGKINLYILKERKEASNKFNKASFEYYPTAVLSTRDTTIHYYENERGKYMKREETGKRRGRRRINDWRDSREWEICLLKKKNQSIKSSKSKTLRTEQKGISVERLSKETEKERGKYFTCSPRSDSQSGGGCRRLGRGRGRCGRARRRFVCFFIITINLSISIRRFRETT